MFLIVTKFYKHGKICGLYAEGRDDKGMMKGREGKGTYKS